MKLKKGDKVLIIFGKDKGKKGKILKALIKKNRVIVEGVNLAKKHQKARKTGEKGQTIEVLLPIDVSNVKLICKKCNKPTRVGYKIVKDEKYRICKKCGQES